MLGRYNYSRNFHATVPNGIGSDELTTEPEVFIYFLASIIRLNFIIVSARTCSAKALLHESYQWMHAPLLRIYYRQIAWLLIFYVGCNYSIKTWVHK